MEIRNLAARSETHLGLVKAEEERFELSRRTDVRSTVFETAAITSWLVLPLLLTDATKKPGVMYVTPGFVIDLRYQSGVTGAMASRDDFRVDWSYGCCR